jgi:hypothetical protein
VRCHGHDVARYRQEGGVHRVDVVLLDTNGGSPMVPLILLCIYLLHCEKLGVWIGA